MNLSDLIDAYRDESHDKAVPPFVSDESLTRFAVEGENEACRRANLIRASTDDLCLVSVTAGDPMLALDARILNVQRVTLTTAPYALDPAFVDELDTTPGWEVQTGTPTHYVPDYQTGYLRLYPIPVADVDIAMTVSRLPLAEMSSDSDEPEIPRVTHPALVQWMLYRAYAKQDADLFDPKKSERALAEFEREFGKKASSRNEAWQRSRNSISETPVA